MGIVGDRSRGKGRTCFWSAGPFDSRKRIGMSICIYLSSHESTGTTRKPMTKSIRKRGFIELRGKGRLLME